MITFLINKNLFIDSDENDQKIFFPYGYSDKGYIVDGNISANFLSFISYTTFIIFSICFFIFSPIIQMGGLENSYKIFIFFFGFSCLLLISYSLA